MKRYQSASDILFNSLYVFLTAICWQSLMVIQSNYLKKNIFLYDMNIANSESFILSCITVLQLFGEFVLNLPTSMHQMVDIEDQISY